MAAREKATASLETAPAFAPNDFRAFERHKWSDPDANAERLVLKRKLQAMGEPVLAHLKAHGAELALRTSIHNPFKFNGNRVDALWFYLAPADTAKRPLRDLLGVEFAADTDANYVHANLVTAIDFTGITIGVRVHERAWWDVQNLKARATTREGAEEFARLLNEVKGGYALTLHDWKQKHVCGGIKWDDVLNVFRYCEPGKHRVHVQRFVSKDDPAALSPTLIQQVAAEFVTLLPVYRFILWSPDNNHLGMKRA